MINKVICSALYETKSQMVLLHFYNIYTSWCQNPSIVKSFTFSKRKKVESRTWGV